MEELSWWRRVCSKLAPHGAACLCPCPCPCPSPWGEALLEAAQLGDAYGARALLALGGAPDSPRTRHRQTALCLAACHGHAEVAAVLLAAGADPGAEDAMGATPLARAAAAGHHAVVALFAAARPKAVSSLVGQLLLSAARAAKDFFA
ncbi:hypothetical protein R5R35_001835 [Gryllus longicercus]|uniref:Uncharacterized protein n=1 Tax=Gryllus longicercus TaxID=2509291 RepID=A0AAN9VED0_9ORTH